MFQTSEYEWEDTVASEGSSSSSCTSEDDDPDSSDHEANSEDPFHSTHLHNVSVKTLLQSPQSPYT